MTIKRDEGRVEEPSVQRNENGTHNEGSESQKTRTVSSGVLGGGLLGAGFGPIAAAGGMILGGAAGYLVELHIEQSEQKQED